MCGIVGVVFEDAARPCPRDLVDAMGDVLSYRGPDDAGCFVTGNVGLGHRRLSVIDLGGGHQPMTDASGALTIVFNGEIYNYRSLRGELAAKGHVFRTQSDTEVLLTLYADRGEECVRALNGMFAFAIWDARRRLLFAARDRLGEKPFYYANTGGVFAFASEIKALFAVPAVPRRPREAGLAEYALFRQVSGAESLFAGVSSLPPASTMLVRDGVIAVRRYWSPRPEAGRLRATRAEAREQLAGLLRDAVEMRLVSDVPVGTFCSGGVDSSLVTALAAQLKGTGVNTYSVGFDEPDYDESEFSTLVSRHCGTTHHRLVLGNEQYSELFPRMVWHNDEPLNFANSVQIYALSRLAKDRVTVVLTGEGADELFLGYPRYRLPALAAWARRVPSPLRRTITRLVRDHRLEKLERSASGGPESALLYNASYLRPDLVAAAFPRLGPADLGHRETCLAGSAHLGLEPAERAALLDQETFLVSILNRQDKMSMAAAIESRVPFLDHRVVEFANRLPASFKLHGGTGKAIVKEIARDYLPHAVIDRRKSGFGVPLAHWFRQNTGMGERIAALADRPGVDDFCDPGVLRQLIAGHRSGARDHSELLWTALNLQTWREVHRL